MCVIVEVWNWKRPLSVIVKLLWVDSPTRGFSGLQLPRGSHYTMIMIPYKVNRFHTVMGNNHSQGAKYLPDCVK